MKRWIGPWVLDRERRVWTRPYNEPYALVPTVYSNGTAFDFTRGSTNGTVTISTYVAYRRKVKAVAL